MPAEVRGVGIADPQLRLVSDHHHRASRQSASGMCRGWLFRLFDPPSPARCGRGLRDQGALTPIQEQMHCRAPAISHPAHFVRPNSAARCPLRADHIPLWSDTRYQARPIPVPDCARISASAIASLARTREKACCRFRYCPEEHWIGSPRLCPEWNYAAPLLGGAASAGLQHGPPRDPKRLRARPRYSLG